MSPEDLPVNTMLKGLAMSFNAEVYAERLLEHEREKSKWDCTTMPVFFYGEPLFPGGNLSLHLFEPRYKLMMQRIVSTSRSFAYVPCMSGAVAKVGDIALRAMVREVDFQSGLRPVLPFYDQHF